MDIRYLAGLFDGEGSVSIHARYNYKVKKSYTSIVLQLAMCTRKPIATLYKRFGGTFHLTKRRTVSGYKVWHWCIGGLKVEAVLRELLPHLVVKKKQAQLGVHFCQFLRWTESGRGHVVSPYVNRVRKSYASQCRRLNGTT